MRLEKSCIALIQKPEITFFLLLSFCFSPERLRLKERINGMEMRISGRRKRTYKSERTIILNMSLKMMV